MNRLKQQLNIRLNKLAQLASLVLVLIVVALIMSTTSAQASFNQQINYQGKLMTSAGANVTDGTYHMRFKLCTDINCASSVFDETWTSSDKITVTSGLFSVLLGSVSTTAMSTIDFNQDLYLQVTVGGSGVTPTWETLSPAKRLGAVPNAFNAQKFDGLATTSFLRADAFNLSGYFGSLSSTNATFTSLTSTNLFANNISSSQATSTNLFASIFNAIDATISNIINIATAIITNLTATTANITNLVFGNATGTSMTLGNITATSSATLATTTINGRLTIDGSNTADNLLQVVTTTNSSIFVINNFGNVGIGTVTLATTTRLTVKSKAINAHAIEGIAAGTGDTLWSLGEGNGSTAGRLAIRYTNSERILLHGNAKSYINNGANFGIGTTDPSTTLEVVGVVSSTDFQVNGNATTTNLIVSSITNSWLATNASGLVVATATPVLVESDPTFTSSFAYTITSSTNWDTAYSWGNHASAGYLTSANAASTYLSLTDWYTTSTQYLTTTTASSTYLRITDAANTYQPIGSYLTTSTGLTVANFASPNISQWTNDSNYLTTYNSSTAIAVFSSVSSTALQVNGNATTTSLVVSSITNSWLATNANGLVVATTAPQEFITAGTVNDYYRGDKTWAATSTLRLTKSQITDFGTYENPLTFTYPLQRTVDAISLAFGTTTNNTWAGTQTFSTVSSTALQVNGNATTTGVLNVGTLTLTNALGVASGGTGASTLTGLVLGNGTGAFTTITDSSVNWDTAYSWGNHAGLYDVLGQATSTLSSHTTTYNHANYDTAYGWGNHSSVGYLTTYNSSTALAVFSGVSSTNATTTNLAVTSLTNGSILFATSSGVISQDNANFFWDDVNNRLGIGTASPSNLLSLANNNYLAWKDNGSSNENVGIKSNTSNDLTFYVGGADRFYIKNDGNVGIGTTTPTAKLHSYTDTSGQYGLRVDHRSNDTYGTMAYFNAYDADGGYNAGYVSFAAANKQIVSTVTGGATELYIQDQDNNAARLTLDVRGNAGSALGLAVTSNGLVGIGTTTPPHLLTISQATAGTSLGIYNSTNISTNRNWAIINSSNVYGDLDFKQSNAQNGNPYTAGTSRFYLGVDGNVGIGTTTPAYNLVVNGTTGNLLQVATSTNQSIFIINSAGNIGIGQAAPTAPLHVMADGSNNNIRLEENSGGEYNTLSTQTDGSLRIVSDTSAVRYIQFDDGMSGISQVYEGGIMQNYMDVYSDTTTNRPVLQMAHFGGTVAATVTTTANSTLGQIYFTGWNVGARANGAASITGGADGEWGTGTDLSDTPTYISFATTPDGSGTVAERMRISNAGNVGIGTTTPAQKLDVYGSANFGTGAAATDSIIDFSTAGVTKFSMGYDVSTGLFTLTTSTALGTNNILVISSSTGNVAINSATASTTSKFVVYNSAAVWGSFSSGGTWISGSDARLKKDIATLDGSLQKVLGLRPVRYNWIGQPNGSSTGSNIGFIAQEVDQIVPEVVSHDSEYLGLSYGSFAPILAGAIQEQQAQIEVLKDQIAASSTLAVTQSESPQPTIAVTDQDPYLNTLRVANAASFYGTITVIGEAGFQSKVVFEKEVEFNDHLLVDQDTAGTAVVVAGATSTEIIFAKPYGLMPRVVATLKSSGTPMFVQYAIADQSSSTFKIILEQPATADVYFNWIALASKDREGQVAGVQAIAGCMDSTATNYNSSATESDGSCTYEIATPPAGSPPTEPAPTEPSPVEPPPSEPPPATPPTEAPAPPAPVLGCMDSTATNYDPLATQDNGTCTYEPVISPTEPPPSEPAPTEPPPVTP